MNLPQGYKYKQISADTLIKSTKGRLFGLFCSTSSSLIISVHDGASSSAAKIINNVTLAAATPYTFPTGGCEFGDTGLYVEVVSGTGELTVFYI